MKQILFALVMFLGLMPINAQEYDVSDLLGTWNLTSQTGKISSTFETFQSITFGDVRVVKNGRGYLYPYGVITKAICIRENSDGELYNHDYDYVGIHAFVISGGHILNVFVSDSYDECYMGMVIKKLTSKEMILTDYKNTCEIILTKQEGSKVKELQISDKGENEYYSLDGIKVKKPDKGIYIEKNMEGSRLITK